jgi:hypothetical protein
LIDIFSAMGQLFVLLRLVSFVFSLRFYFMYCLYHAKS